MTQSTSTSPPLMKWHELLFSQRSRPSRALHIGFVLALSPLQQPGSSVVDVVVVKSQSESSSVTSHSQALPRAHRFAPSRLRQFSLWLIVAMVGMARQQPGASVVVDVLEVVTTQSFGSYVCSQVAHVRALALLRRAKALVVGLVRVWVVAAAR